MAIAFVSASAPVAGGRIATPTVTLNAPAGIVAGNLLLAYIYSGAAATATITPPAGWTLIDSSTQANTSGQFFAYSRIATGAEPTTYTWTLSAGSYNNGAILQYSGVAAAISDAHALTAFSTGTATLTAPAVTATASGDMLVTAYGTYSGPAVTSGPSGATSRYTSESAGNDGLEIWDRSLGVAGASGTSILTTASTTPGVAHSLALLAPTKWINRTVVAAPRNGTTSHTVNFTAATSGNLLVAVIEGAVTSTTPTGWTLPAGGSAVNATGLYVWYKTATAGEASFTTTHNGSNYPVISAVYEFPAGSTFVAAASAISQPAASSGPTLSGLTGTNSLFGMTARGVVNSDVATYTWSAPAGILKDVDQGVISSGTDGYAFSLAYLDGSTATSWNPSSTATSGGSEFERVTFAVKVATAGAGTVTGSGAGSATTTSTGASSLAVKAAGAAAAVTAATAAALLTITGGGAGSATTSATGSASQSSIIAGAGAGSATTAGTGAGSLRIAGAGSASAATGATGAGYQTTAGAGSASAITGATGSSAVTIAGTGAVSATTSATGAGVATSTSTHSGTASATTTGTGASSVTVTVRGSGSGQATSTATAASLGAIGGAGSGSATTTVTVASYVVRGGTGAASATSLATGAGLTFTPGAARNITVTIGQPAGHPLAIGTPAGHPLRVGAPTGHALTIGPPEAL